ncbi:MAG: trypsin-like peptidase domain-containing protein [Symploca sp. SIO1B1]|nr:trypsin-like peptidase domain-containing protein [Symploca sp. SIO1B1]
MMNLFSKFPLIIISTIVILYPSLACNAQVYPKNLITNREQADIEQAAREFTVLIGIKNLGSSRIDEKGSGVIIAKQRNLYYVLTAAHNFDDEEAKDEEYVITTHDGKSYPIKNRIQIWNRLSPTREKLDLNVVLFTTSNTKPNYKYAKLIDSNNQLIADSSPPPLDSVIYAAGFPHSATGFRFASGRYKGDRISNRGDKEFSGYDFYYSDDTNVVDYGMSGGPILDQNGQLVGIHCYGRKIKSSNPTGTHISLGIKITTFWEKAPSFFREQIISSP